MRRSMRTQGRILYADQDKREGRMRGCCGLIGLSRRGLHQVQVYRELELAGNNDATGRSLDRREVAKNLSKMQRLRR